MRAMVAVFAAFLMSVAMAPAAPRAAAQPPECHDPSCTPGIAPNIVLGSYCSSTTHYVFGVTSWGRLVFCGSPRRYEPRWFRSPEMHGIKNENDGCSTLEGGVAQAPDGMFLSCVVAGDPGRAYWTRGDTPPRPGDT
ncbi:hypothetical protein [Mycolicibacterium baixiangningiae]|uniref:hypothetical protein n=1 Tax=Mycolicibacterium baixiangningiae TaxID=2761578 RepID=UPI0018D0CDE3